MLRRCRRVYTPFTSSSVLKCSKSWLSRRHPGCRSQHGPCAEGEEHGDDDGRGRHGGGTLGPPHSLQGSGHEGTGRHGWTEISLVLDVLLSPTSWRTVYSCLHKADRSWSISDHSDAHERWLIIVCEEQSCRADSVPSIWRRCWSCGRDHFTAGRWSLVKDEQESC